MTLHSLAAGGGRHRARSGSPLRAFWQWVSGKGRPYVRLLFEVHVLALQRPREFAPYLDRTSRSWIAAIEQMLPPSRDRRVRATLCAAVVDGLLLELLSTGDHRRTSAALVTFERLLHRQARGR